jgi:hypothetical protein
MSQKNRRTLVERVTKAAEASLATQHYASPVDVFLRIGWLNPTTLESWRRGQADCLESVIGTAAPRMLEAMRLLQDWATGGGLIPSEASYTARTPQRQALRFTQSGDPAIEAQYRIHWVSRELSAKKRQSVTEKANRAPDLVVVVPLKSDWKCHRCGGTGDLLIMQDPGPSCLACAGLGDLEFLPAGDALLSRRANAKSERRAVVVCFSRTRRRYERQGLLVEPRILADVRRELEAERRAHEDAD